MKFKSILLALFIGAAGVCFAAENKPAAAPAPQAQVNPAPAAADAGAKTENTSGDSEKPAPKKGGSSIGQWIQMLMPIILIVVMIFIFSRSNKKQQQKRQQMLDSIVKGTRVMLNSGVYGKVYAVRENEFEVEIADGVRVLVVKNGIASVEDEEADKKEADKKETK